ncbi:hypothetical protein UMM65_03615 [Aureibaculum sp. 2210JD6-5]|uniref:MauE/DoxX family redox-associated membrane protein n=1 Tax=Aureibaculum sp. 2210JD6-5 TaxID=3103957 RepID=UPI002AAE21EB|nr:MauE/DoxX family redox-associated membrane protein [Aureibaculum sp. 2210JD6-5]MDY7394314.1 hypothetical protein [Aureibaculum sp. 2210JD6-5]
MYFKGKKILIEIICSLLAMLFIYAAVSKILEYQDFKVQIGKSPMLTDFRNWLVWFIPTLEIIISLMLLIPKYRLFGLYAYFSLMTMFTTYIILIMNFSEFIPCSCGGILEDLGWGEHLVFNLFFILINLVAIVIGTSQSKTNLISQTLKYN